MLAKKCDFCGNFYDHYDGSRDNEEEANAIIFSDRSLDGHSLKRKLYDLCPDCMDKLLRMIRNESSPTLDEMRKCIADYCGNRKCKDCSIYERFFPQLPWKCFDASNEDVKKYYEEIKRIKEEE